MKTEFQKNGQELTVVIDGSVDTVTAPELEKELKEQWNDLRKLVLDFAGVTYISSAGLRVVMTCDKELDSRGGQFIIRHINDEVREVFEMTGFDELLTFE